MPITRRVRISKREYNEYLKSDHWRLLRHSVLSQRSSCERCKNRPPTQVHHLEYKNLFDVTSNDLVALCSDCHTRIHMALDFGVLKDATNKQAALELSNDQITLALSSKRKHVVLDEVMLRRINSSNLKIQRRICGVLRIQHPGDFLLLSKTKTTSKRFKYIEWLVRRNEHTNLVRPLGRKAKRKAKDARKLASLLEQQAFNRRTDSHAGAVLLSAQAHHFEPASNKEHQCT